MAASPRTGRYLAAHLAFLAAFVLLTQHLFNGGPGAWSCPALLVGLWIACGTGTTATLLAAAVPPRSWMGIVRRNLDLLAAGTAIAAGTMIAGSQAAAFWRPMGRLTLEWASAMLGVFAEPVCNPDCFLIGTRAFQVRIDAACSGYQGIGLVLVFLAAYLFLCRKGLRFPHAFVLLPLGAGLIWVLNAARIAALVAVGTWISPEIALGAFHSLAGWLSQIAVLLALVYAAGRCRWFARLQSADATVEPNPLVPLLAPFVVLIVTGMATGALADQLDPWYGLRVFTVGAALWACRRTYARWDWSISVEAVALGALAWALWLTLETSGDNAARAAALEQAFRDLPAWAGMIWLALRVLGSVVIVPVAEELAFRGFLLRGLAVWPNGGRGDWSGDASFAGGYGRASAWIACLVSSLLFGLMHESVLAGTAAGMAYAIAFRRRGRISDAIAAHAVTNSLIAAQVLLSGAWRLWT